MKFEQDEKSTAYFYKTLAKNRRTANITELNETDGTPVNNIQTHIHDFYSDLYMQTEKVEPRWILPKYPVPETNGGSAKNNG